MKSRTSFLLFLLVMQVLPLLANDFDYLNVYMKDGSTDRHLLSLVQKIETTKYDKDGVLQSYYCTQQITMADSTVYTYTLTDIDSIVYCKVEEEQIEQALSEALPTLEEIFGESDSPEEMAEQLEQLQALEGVESVSFDSSSVTVQIKDWRSITYHFSIEPTLTDDQMYSARRRQDEGQAPLLDDYAPKVNNSVKVVIANQMHNNLSTYRQNQISNLMQPLCQEFCSLGFDAVYDYDVNFDFFENRMFDNDIVLLDTHGSYRTNTGHHWVTTGEEVATSEHSAEVKAETLTKLRKEIPHDFNETDFSAIEEVRNNKLVYVYYYKVSENFIDKQNRTFHNTIPPIFFNVACESMKGNDDMQQYVSGTWIKGNSSMADVFLEKGIDTYFGYNQSNAYGQQTGADILHAMLLGCSEEKAVSLLRPVQKFENRILDENLVDAYLMDWLSENTTRGQFIVKTFTTATIDEQASSDYAASMHVNVIGLTTKLRNTLVKTEIVSEPTIVAGFRYGSDESLSSCKYIDNLEFVPVEHDLGNYAFTAALPAIPGQTVYYQAYTYDGMHYNLGEVRSFTVEEQEEKHEYVDLGLPSGLLWATSNVGAKTPWEEGDYFAWGETTGFASGKTMFNSGTYRYFNESSKTLTKYCFDSEYGIVDYLTTLSPADDAATANWGEDWRMPTWEEVQELFSYCSPEWVDGESIGGFEFIGPSGESIYLPCAGYRLDDKLISEGVLCSYWTSTLDDDNPNCAMTNTFGGVPSTPDAERWYGLSVRPVYAEKNNYTGAIAIEENELTFTSVSTQRELNLTADCDWKAKVTTGAGWLRVSPAQGTGDARIVINASTNISGSPRTGVITISSNNSKPITITVYQDCEYVFATRTVGGHTYTIKWYYDKEDKRVNGDGSVFYATWFIISKDGEEHRLAEKYYIYTDNNDDRLWAGASAAFDVVNDVCYFFAFGKDASGSYSMSGNLYEIRPSYTQKYELFTGKNWGWYSYFSYGGNAIVLNAFSYNGYYRLLAAKGSTTWAMKQGAYIKPDAFLAERRENETILVFEDNPQDSEEYTQSINDLSCLNFSTYGYKINTPGYPGEEFDFEEAAEFLGITDITKASCYIINPDGSCSSPTSLSYLYYDANGYESNSKEYALCFEYHSANSGFFAYQDATLLEEGEKYTLRFAASYGNKTVIFVYNLEIVPENSNLSYGGCPDDNHPHVIDLGCGVCWSCCNLGAAWPGDRGGYYAWGETNTKNNYLFENYAFYKDLTYRETKTDIFEMSGISSKYNTETDNGPVDNILVLQPEDDAAYQHHGSVGEWRIPTDVESEKLLKLDHYLAMPYGILGYVFYSDEGYIFLPFGGYIAQDGQWKRGNKGLYWASTYPKDASFCGDCIDLYTDKVLVNDFLRYQGFNIRPVYNSTNAARAQNRVSANGKREDALLTRRPAEAKACPEFILRDKKITESPHMPAKLAKKDNL